MVVARYFCIVWYTLTVWVTCFLFENFFLVACAKSCVVDLGLLNLAINRSSVTSDLVLIYSQKIIFFAVKKVTLSE